MPLPVMSCPNYPPSNLLRRAFDEIVDKRYIMESTHHLLNPPSPLRLQISNDDFSNHLWDSDGTIGSLVFFLLERKADEMIDTDG